MGERRLEIEGGEARRLGPGDTFHVRPNVPHSEKYSEREGATYWVARKNVAAAPR